MMRLKRADEICRRFAAKNILIFGDVILDRYIFGTVERISPEAPVPVVKVTEEQYRLGGAGNVAKNVDKLGAAGTLLGITGADAAAGEIRNLKPQHNLSLADSLNHTIVKTRVMAQRQQVVRIDREDHLRWGADSLALLERTIAAITPDAVIVSDYAKGTVNPDTMAIVKRRAAELRIPVIVDPKPPHFSLYDGVTGITPNLREAEAMTGRTLAGDAQIHAALRLIRRRFHTDFAVITRGGEGISAAGMNRRLFHFPAFSHEVFDVTGAGDTVVAVLTLALVSGATLHEAVGLANAAASIVVEKIGTSQITVDELHERLRYLLRKS